ncbi:MAG TPA: peptidylprolyl isomerase, partial [Ilumatobacteraceae bacterium]|nr:peptidylprolyl isomerase [Ilumatobacteraceae bacterium]
LAATPDSGVTEDTETGTIPADTARSVLTTLVNREAALAFLDANGQPITDEDRQAFLDTVPEDDPLFDYPEEVRDIVVDLNAAQTARARIAAPAADELQRRYEEEPETLGVVCIRHVVVGTEAAADDVLARLDAGESIADVAADVSVDTSTASNGGAVEGGDGSACVPAAALRANAADLADIALVSRPGTPTGPAQSQLGWHVVEARPYDEVADSLAALFDASAGDLLFDSALGDIDVDVDPRYGRWDALSRRVVEL